MPLYPARSLNYINLKDYCKIDGTSDDSIGFTAAYTLASSLGMALWHPGGRLIKGNDTLLSNVAIDGAGTGISIIQLKNGANTDLFSAQTGSINLAAAGNTGILGTLSRFAIRGITLDGNKANQSSGTSYPLRFYGYDFELSRLEILNGYSGGLLCDWNYGSGIAPPSDQMEAIFDTIKIHDNNNIGLQMGGPHDSRLINILIFSNGSHNFHFGPNANGIQGSNMHAYLVPNVTGVCNWLIEIAFGCNFVNCISDGGYATGVAIIGTSVAWQGEIYTSNSGVTGVQIGQQAGNTPFPGQVNQSAGVTTAVQASATFLNASINGCTGGGINVANEVNSYLLANIFQISGNAIVGTLAASDTYLIKVTGLTPDGTLATSGGMQIVSSANPAFKILNNAGGTIFHVDGFAGGTSGVDVPGGFHIVAGGNVGINTSPNASVALLFTTGADANKGIVVYAHSATQSANLLELQNATFGPVFQVDKAGNTSVSGHVGLNTGYNAGIAQLIGTGADATTGLVIFPTNSTQSAPLLAMQNSSFANVFTVDKNGVMQLQGASSFLSGSGVPSNSNGANGDFYFRNDTPGTALQRIYAKSAGSWVGII